MQAQRTTYGWILRLDRGEEIVGSLAAFAAREGIRAGFLSAIGAVGEAELGFFGPERRTYERRTFTGDHEIGSLTGNLSELEGRPFAHCHIVLAGPDFIAHTGHLFRGVITVTCEVQIVTDPGVLARLSRPAEGFNPIDPR
ncbi:MAG TPA: PPC domain-containing DNA-binding protein [Candidatus Acidoferrales bacterium]|nr:PPC domain-containing DNA-binding protein [Candidatus Acidoferrales bacterium]